MRVLTLVPFILMIWQCFGVIISPFVPVMFLLSELVRFWAAVEIILQVPDIWLANQFNRHASSFILLSDSVCSPGIVLLRLWTHVTFSQTLSVSVAQAVVALPTSAALGWLCSGAQLLRASLWREVGNLEFKSFKFQLKLWYKQVLVQTFFKGVISLGTQAVQELGTAS